MIELCSEYLSVRPLWLSVLVISRTSNSLLEVGVKPQLLSIFISCIYLYSELELQFLEILATIDCGFNLKRVHGIARTYSQMHHSKMHRTDKYSEHSLIVWPVWLNG